VCCGTENDYNLPFINTALPKGTPEPEVHQARFIIYATHYPAFGAYRPFTVTLSCLEAQTITMELISPFPAVDGITKGGNNNQILIDTAGGTLTSFNLTKVFKFT